MLYGDMSLELEPVGIVRSDIVERREMPAHGVTAVVEVFPEYHDGLHLIEDNTHLWIIGWFVGAERDQLQIVRPEYRPGQRRRGVFGLRSTTRPNSIGLTAVRLLNHRDGTLTVDHLDFLDGTPVLDIKRYSPSWDSIFSARSSQDRYIEPAEAARLDMLEVDGAKFHGTLTARITAAAKLMQYAVQHWEMLPRDPELVVTVPVNAGHAEYADALQGMTGATFGTGRLRVHHDPAIVLAYQGRALTATPLPLAESQPKAVRSMALEELFLVTEG